MLVISREIIIVNYFNFQINNYYIVKSIFIISIDNLKSRLFCLRLSFIIAYRRLDMMWEIRINNLLISYSVNSIGMNIFLKIYANGLARSYSAFTFITYDYVLKNYVQVRKNLNKFSWSAIGNCVLATYTFCNQLLSVHWLKHVVEIWFLIKCNYS